MTPWSCIAYETSQITRRIFVMSDNGYTAHIEPVAGCLRVFAPGKQFGSPSYGFCGTVRYIDIRTIEICGVRKPAPTPPEWRAIRNLCKAEGITTVVIKRVRDDGTEERREIRISRES